MNNEIFDRETKLDLLVNVIPLFILGFFIVGFIVFAPFGIDPLASAIQFGLIAIPFVLLTVLTYFAAVAVAGSENSGPVYLPGQAGVSGAEPLEVPEGDEDVPQEADAGPTELDGDQVASEDEDADESAAPASDDDGAETESDDAEAATAAADETESADDATDADDTDDATDAAGDESDADDDGIEADEDPADDDSERNS